MLCSPVVFCESLHFETPTPLSDVFDVAGLLHLLIGVLASARAARGQGVQSVTCDVTDVNVAQHPQFALDCMSAPHSGQKLGLVGVGLARVSLGSGGVWGPEQGPDRA